MCGVFIWMFSLSYTPERRNMQVEALLRYTRYSRMRMCVSGLRKKMCFSYCLIWACVSAVKKASPGQAEPLHLLSAAPSAPVAIIHIPENSSAPLCHEHNSYHCALQLSSASKVLLYAYRQRTTYIAIGMAPVPFCRRLRRFQLLTLSDVEK
jgi:hypothetical protein